MKTREQNRNNKQTKIERFDWFIECSGGKSFMPENFLEINPYFAVTSYCNTIGQVFFGGKTKKPRFDLFIHWLIKQIKKTYRIQFSRSHENRFIDDVNTQRQIFSLISLNVYALPKNSTPDENSS